MSGRTRALVVLACLVLIELSAFVLAGCASTSSPKANNDAVADPAQGRLVQSEAAATVVQPQPPAGSCHARGSGLFSLPDRRCTPGAVNSAVSTQQNIGATICREGYTDTVRPPESVTEPEKRASLAAYGERGPLHDYEYDHLIPLALGGGVNDPRNMWPEPGASPNPKDRLEDELSELTCRRRVSLAFAQRLIARNWIAAGRWVHKHLPGFSWRVT
jgi:hypothetical protein